ncbi:hypothetical protein F8M41_018290 [Gigaspora margarita]|uniref:Uncharacterized protein n=1 Tax=Gigaspora margarita TaxID=4874 RepID=A0A8H4ALX1_GIGMA|nr:hypothetical protein F8M41_018290 [Gigaspora margarita]
MEQNLLVSVYIDKEFKLSDQIMNIDEIYAFIHLVKSFTQMLNHEHVSYMELLGDVLLTSNLINYLSFRYQSDKIQEFTTILKRCNLQNTLNVCEKDSVVTIYNKESLNFHCKQHLDLKNIKVQKRKVDIRKYQIKL